MALVVNLVSGSTTITLNSSSKKVRSYVPRTPQVPPEQLYNLIGVVRGPDEPTVVETISVIIEDSSEANVKAAINAIEKMVALDAPRRQRLGAGDRVFLKVTPHNGSAYRSEILRGRVDLAEGSLGAPRWNAFKVDIIITIERRPFFELDSLTTLELTNGNGTNVTTGLNVYNCNDATGSSPNKLNNYVEIAAADIAGVLPAPVQLEITNSFGSTARRFYIGHKAQGTPASWTNFLEAEDATLNATYAASAVDADCSGGDKVTVTNVPATAATLATWTITNTQAGYMLNQWVRFLARFEDRPNNSTCQLRLTLQDSVTGAVIGQTDWTTLNDDDELQAIGTLILSPNLQGQTTLGALKLVLEGKDSAATCDFGLDFVWLMPIEGGTGFRYLKPIDETLVTVPASTGVLIDNPIDGAEPEVEGRQDVYAGYGGPIMLVPDTINRLYFAHDGPTNGDAAIDRLLSIVVKYRPRVLTV